MLSRRRFLKWFGLGAVASQVPMMLSSETHRVLPVANQLGKTQASTLWAGQKFSTVWYDEPPEYVFKAMRERRNAVARNA